MSAVTLLLEAVLIYGFTRVLWRVFRSYIVRSPLDNIPGPPRDHSASGNLLKLHDPYDWQYTQDACDRFGAVWSFSGWFGDKCLYLFDPLAMQHILLKDQAIYEEMEGFLLLNEIALGRGLLATKGDHHRRQRKMLNPVFSAAHMRYMTPIFYNVAGHLRQALLSATSKQKEVDMFKWTSRAALEFVGQGGLGYSFDALVEDKPNPYGTAMKSFMSSITPIFMYNVFLPFVVKVGTPEFRRRMLDWIPWKDLQTARRVVDTIDFYSRDVFKVKKRALMMGDEVVKEQVGEGKDIMSKLLQANVLAAEKDKLPEEELIGQMSSLVFAATDTTSSALTHILQLLAEHPEVQDKLRNELIEARAGRESIPYDELIQLPYLEAVLRETLRLYCPVTTAFRIPTQDMVLPLATPIRGLNGQLVHEIAVPKGTTIDIGLMAWNTSLAYWGEDAREWKPERWLSPLPEAITNARVPGIYSNLMTFAGGDRACIGYRFSQLESKIVLAVLLEAFRFSPTEKPINWVAVGVAFPETEKGSMKPSLPLIVEALPST